MKQVILAPVGRAEPDDVQGWLEQGGGMGLQIAWQMPPAMLRTHLNRIQRRDGHGTVTIKAGTTALVTLSVTHPVQRFIGMEMPIFIIEGALILARATEQHQVMIEIGAERAIQRVWQEVLAKLERLGIIGQSGWTQTEIHLVATDSGNPGESSLSLDALTARLFPIVLWERADPPVTLLYTAGRFPHHTLYEVPLGLTVREFVFNWAGGIPLDSRLSLGGRVLEQHEWNLPLTYEQWGEALGAGDIECL
jgi:hypothetical protein